MKVTQEELLEAAKKNGFEHVAGYWFRSNNYNAYDSDARVVGRKDEPITAACFMGQVAINLGVEGNSLFHALNEHFARLGDNIVYWNDSEQNSYDKIYERVAEQISAFPLSKPLELRKAKYYAKRKGE